MKKHAILFISLPALFTFAAQAAEDVLLYDNSILTEHWYAPLTGGFTEVCDFGRAIGGTVTKIKIAYVTTLYNPGPITIRFYNYVTSSHDPDYPMRILTVSGLEGSPDGNAYIFYKEIELSESQQFTLVNDQSFGYSYEFSNSSTGVALAGGGNGQVNNFWLYNDWISFWQFSSISGSWAGCYIQLWSGPPIDQITCDICGYKFNDLNGNGIWDSGEPAIPGWEVYLDLNGNGQKDPGEPNSITNDPNGMYFFENLDAPAVYTIREVLKPGWTQTFPGGPICEYVINAEPNHQYDGYHFGNTTLVQPLDIAISGYVRSNGRPLKDVRIEAYENATVPTGLIDYTDAFGYYEIILPSPWTGSMVLEKSAYLFNDPVYYSGRTTDITEDFEGEFLYGGGEGTEAAPYEIQTARQMSHIGRQPLDWDRHFILTTDIDMSLYTGTAYRIIGSDSSPFSGRFNGNNHVIRNFTYKTESSETKNYVGLFGYVQNAQIFNLGLENISLSAGMESQYVGGLVGYQSSGSIQQCAVSGAVVCAGNGRYLGGLAGCLHNMTAVNCRSDVNVSSSLGGAYIGGFAGMASNLTNCYSVGKVTASEDAMHVGGLAGFAPAGAIVSSYWDTQTSSQPAGSGGTPKTTQEMQKMSTYASWDFDAVWRICDGTNYPRLQWEEKCIADFLCPDGVGIEDLAVLTDEWLTEKLDADIAPDSGNGFVDLLDWACLAAAWLTTPVSPNWNPVCDIAPAGGDNIVDLLDLALLVDSWLAPSLQFCDLAPAPDGDGRVDLQDFAVFAELWLETPW